jgi:hypothetical protein
MWEVEFGHAITNTELMGRTSPEIHQRFPSSSSDSSGTSHRPSVTSATDSPRSYTSSPPMYSPASSVCSYFSKSEDESCNPLKAKPLRVKKTVSFHPGRPETIPIEPIDTYTSPITSKTLQFRPPNPSLRPVICYTITTPQIDAIASDTMPSFLIFRSIDRYNTHFATIRTQLTHHLSTTAELILSIENAQHLSPKIKINQSYGTNEKGNLPTMFDSYKYALPDIMESGQEEKARQRKARIAELKQRGVDWKLGRGRFDGSRYERLCQEALKELQV